MRRHETVPRAQGIENGLAARIHDPLWQLARQWQFGEFRAEDAASPAYVDVDAEVHLLDGWRPAGDDGWRPYDPAAVPLERLVEEEPGGAGRDSRLYLEAALELRRLLNAADSGALLAVFAAAFPYATDGPGVAPAQNGLAAAVRRRLPDGRRLAGSLARLADPTMRAAEADVLGLPTATRAVAATVAGDWLQWWEPRALPEGDGGRVHPDAWDENRLEYAFDIGASTLPGTQLTAAGYAAGRLDWWAVDARAGGEPPAEQPARMPIRSVPAPARYGGMPAPRFWEMEDARFDPGSVDAAPNDLGRLLLVSFATMYGNDWFALPVPLPIGSLSRFASFTLTDVFGRRTEVAAAGVADDGWNLFGVTDAAQPRPAGAERATSPWFFLAPALPDALESPPVETVLLARDEMANLAWAIEALVTDDAGGQRDRFSEAPPRPSVAPRAPGAAPRYRVDTDVAAHWYPLAPEKLANRESVRLRLVPLVRRIDGEPTTELPLGSLLASARADGDGEVWLHEEEVPRAGVAVVRTHQHARWHDGSVHAWTGRRKATGPGEGTSGLRFDTIEPS